MSGRQPPHEVAANQSRSAVTPATSCVHPFPAAPAHDQWPPSALTSIRAATRRMASQWSAIRTRMATTPLCGHSTDGFPKERHPNPAGRHTLVLPLHGWPPNGLHPNMADYTAGFHFSLPTLADRALTVTRTVTLLHNIKISHFSKTYRKRNSSQFLQNIKNRITEHSQRYM